MQVVFPPPVTEKCDVRYLNGFSILAVVVAFSIGAGVGSGLGYRMGSSQIAVYTNQSPHLLQADDVERANDAFTELQEQSDSELYRSIGLLQETLSDIERRVVFLEEEREGSTETRSQSGSVEVSQISSSAGEQLLDQLQNAGFNESEVEVISAKRDQLRLKRLQLRDKAIREGWFRSESWVRQVRDLDADTEVRKTIGDQRFDDYLIATGRTNRVRIDELMTGSAAEQAGLLPGDLIHRYADSRVFTGTELRGLTTGGRPGENTSLTVLREGELIDLNVPRGPLGVTISGFTLNTVDQ